MSKEAWFRNYERLYNERAAGEREGTDEELSDIASQKLKEDISQALDSLGLKVVKKPERRVKWRKDGR